MAENTTGAGALSRRDFLTGSAVAAAGAEREVFAFSGIHGIISATAAAWLFWPARSRPTDRSIHQKLRPSHTGGPGA